MNTQVQNSPAISTRMPLKAFLVGQGFNALSKVRANSNGYKYVTANHLSEEGISTKAENIYLGTRYSDSVELGQTLDIETLFVVPTTNAAGAERIKITDQSGVLSPEKLAEYQVI